MEVASDREFPVRNEMVLLLIGSHEFGLSRYPDGGDFHALIFTLTADQFVQTMDGAPVRVQYGHAAGPNDRWDFGSWDKKLLDR